MEIKSEIEITLQNIESNKDIYLADNFIQRSEIIDLIEFEIIDRIVGQVHDHGPDKVLETLQNRAYKIVQTLEIIDSKLFTRLEDLIKNANDKRSITLNIIEKYLNINLNNLIASSQIGYDHSDTFIHKLFENSSLEKEVKIPESEMIYFQKTPVRIIIELALTLNKTDVFYDIGSGLGQGVILAGLISGAKSIGVEYEPAYNKYAMETLSKFDLNNVEFITEDARNIDYSDGTIFYLYTPFIGKMMEEMIQILQKLSLEKAIKIFTYGPCSLHFLQVNWLKCINGKVDSIYKLYEFRCENYLCK